MNQLVEEWLAKAEEDWRSAKVLLSDAAPLVTPALFHMQQSAEKMLKAFLIKNGIPFERRHDLSYLLHLAGEHTLQAHARLLNELNPFAVEIRYPGDLPSFSTQEALRLLNSLEDFRDALVPIIIS